MFHFPCLCECNGIELVLAVVLHRFNVPLYALNDKAVWQHAQDCDAAVPGPDTPFQTRLNEFGTEGRVLAPVVGTWCETSDDFDLLIELIAHALADKETSMLRVAHDQAVARQRQKLTAD